MSGTQETVHSVQIFLLESCLSIPQQEFEQFLVEGRNFHEKVRDDPKNPNKFVSKENPEFPFSCP